MKKSERITEIKKRAYQYAKSGKYINYHLVEHILCAVDGFPEARTELDSLVLREEINSLCKTATSPEELSRKQYFGQWMDEVLETIRPELSKYKLDIHRSTGEEVFSIYGPNYSFTIRRCFGSRKLEYNKAIGGYSFPFQPAPSSKDFNTMTSQDVLKMITDLADGAGKMAMVLIPK